MGLLDPCGVSGPNACTNRDQRAYAQSVTERTATAAPAPAPAPASGRARGWVLVQRAVGVAIVVAAVAVVASRWPEISPQLARLRPWVLVAAGACIALALVASCLSWRVLLTGAGHRLPLADAGRIFLVSQLGKYLPGSVWPVVTQAALGRAAGIPVGVSATVGLLAMGLSLGIGLLVGLAAGVGATLQGWYLAAALAALAVALPFMLVPRLAGWAVDRALALVRRGPLNIRLTARTLYGSQALIVLAWAGYGLSTWLLARELGPLDASDLVQVTGGYALAMSIGMVVVVAPAGAGVREVVLALTLSGLLTPDAAVALALVSRAVITVVDLLAAGVASLLVLPRLRRRT